MGAEVGIHIFRKEFPNTWSILRSVGIVAHQLGGSNLHKREKYGLYCNLDLGVRKKKILPI